MIFLFPKRHTRKRQCSSPGMAPSSPVPPPQDFPILLCYPPCSNPGQTWVSARPTPLSHATHCISGKHVYFLFKIYSVSHHSPSPHSHHLRLPAYCNSFQVGLSSLAFVLQNILNRAAKMMLLKCKAHHAIPFLKPLQGFPFSMKKKKCNWPLEGWQDLQPASCLGSPIAHRFSPSGITSRETLSPPPI